MMKKISNSNYYITMSPLVSGIGNNLAIDNLVQLSLENENKYLRLEWISCNIEPIKSGNVYYANCGAEELTVMLSLLGNGEECTPTLVSEFARIHSLPTHKYNNDISQFKRYSEWLSHRNKFIKGFTKYDGSYYMVTHPLFYHFYSLYGFCSAC